MSAHDIAAIAEGLTQRQREAIRNAQDMHSSHGGYPFFAVDFTDPWTAPVAEFLTLKSDRLTPLGIAVRRHLEQERG